MNYEILYIRKNRRLNIVYNTMCEESELGNVINALQASGERIFAIFSTKKEF